MKQNQKTFLATVAILALPSFMLWDSYFSPTTPAPAEFEIGHVYFSEADTDAVPPQGVSHATSSHPHQKHRSLRLPQYSDPKSISISPRVNSTIAVYLVGGSKMGTKPTNSIFLTDTLKRYGSERLDYHIREHSKCFYTCTRPSLVEDNGPCLVVADRDCDIEYLKCNYPQCKTMRTGDEKCEVGSHDVREYYSASLSNKAYLPLGPRLDSWTSFQKIQSSPHFFMKPPSKRQFVFNAIFSQSTDVGRQELAKIIEEQHGKSDLSFFTIMAKRWKPAVNDPRTEQLNTDSYMEVLSDSFFTLAPAGHNPECYRMFEAVEAGSIPVFVKNDLYVTETHHHPCKEALHHWYDAPILVLESWDDLFPTMERLMGNMDALDEMQVNLRMWYDEYMHKVVVEFEDFMLESYKKKY